MKVVGPDEECGRSLWKFGHVVGTSRLTLSPNQLEGQLTVQLLMLTSAGELPTAEASSI